MLDKFERYPLMFGPTPIERLGRLSEALGREVEIWAKRDDCNSGLAFGGNKIRKLEYIVPDAIASNADTLVTIGGVQSNHTRQVAAVAAKLGMKCRLVQESWVPFEDAVYDRVGNILMSRVMGAEIELVDEGFDIGIRESWERALEDVKAKGGKPYPIPAGASVHRLGGLGYVGFAEEVRAQEAEMAGIRFDYVIVCTVTGSTHAGMLVGFAKDGRARNVIGIDASATPDQTRDQVLDIARNTGRPRRARSWYRRGRRRARRRLRLSRLRHPVRGDERRDPALRPHRGDDDGPRVRGKIDAGPHRPHPQGLLPRRLQGALRAPRRGPRDQRLQLRLPQRLSRPPPGLRTLPLVATRALSDHPALVPLPSVRSHPLVYQWVDIAFQLERLVSLTSFDDRSSTTTWIGSRTPCRPDASRGSRCSARWWERAQDFRAMRQIWPTVASLEKSRMIAIMR